MAYHAAFSEAIALAIGMWLSMAFTGGIQAGKIPIVCLVIHAILLLEVVMYISLEEICVTTINLSLLWLAGFSLYCLFKSIFWLFR